MIWAIHVTGKTRTYWSHHVLLDWCEYGRVENKIIHPKYYKHLKKGAHQDKNWAGVW